jgi:hypothetical protein
VQSQANVSTEQDCIVVSVGNGYFSFVNRWSGMSVGTSGGSVALAGFVQQLVSSSAQNAIMADCPSTLIASVRGLSLPRTLRVSSPRLFRILEPPAPLSDLLPDHSEKERGERPPEDKAAPGCAAAGSSAQADPTPGTAPGPVRSANQWHGLCIVRRFPNARHLGPPPKSESSASKGLRHSGIALAFKTTFEVFTGVGPDNSLERLAERGVGLVTDRASDVYQLFVTLLQ